ncbi:MAG: PDZ domain-containing protein [bacterium]|nr:PDZ domain-containing protein [bacterium]
MDVEPTPTSPKAKRQRELEKLYSDKELSQLHRPPAANGRVFAAILAIVIGVFSGFFGGYFFYTFFSTELTESVPSIQVDRNSRNPGTVLSDEFQSQTVGVYLAKEDLDASDPVSNLYHPWEQLSAGVWVTSDGWITAPRWSVGDLTLNYVAVDSSGSAYPIDRIIADPASWLYFLHVEGENFPAAEFSSQEELIPSDSVFVVERNGRHSEILPTFLAKLGEVSPRDGSGYYHTSDEIGTRYHLSEALGEEFQGAPVFDTRGNLVGIVGSSAWPANEVFPAYHIRSALNSLLRNGEVIRAKLGVQYIDLAQTQGMPSIFSENLTAGALVYSDAENQALAVEPNSPAETAALAKGDIITRVNSEALSEIRGLADLIHEYGPGDRVELEVQRDGKKRSVEVILATQK